MGKSKLTDLGEEEDTAVDEPEEEFGEADVAGAWAGVPDLLGHNPGQ